MSKTFKRKYPLSEEDSTQWDKVQKVDAPVAHISKRSSLPFEDTGNIAVTCTARALRVWLEQLEDHLNSKNRFRAPFLFLKKLFILSDSSADSVRLAAKADTLSNMARRSSCLCSWSSNAGS